MRPLASAILVSTLVLHSLGNAQESQPAKRDGRLFLSAGFGSSLAFTGLHLGAEYQLTPVERVLAVRAHLGAFWTPTQMYSRPSALYGPGSTFEGSGQVMHVDLGVTGSITPWPRARVSPYVFGGLAALQRWTYGSGYYRRADGSAAEFRAPSAGTTGQFGLVVGAGLRVRTGGRVLLFEIRNLPGIQSTYNVGTTLHF
jgi:hypothetical protein